MTIQEMPSRRSFIASLLALPVVAKALVKTPEPVGHYRVINWPSEPGGLRGIVDDGEFATTIHGISRSGDTITIRGTYDARTAREC